MSKYQPYPPTPFYDRLTEISKLADGWLDGAGKAPSEEALKSASVLGAALPTSVPLRVYPTEAGGVSLEWDDQHGGHEIEVQPDGHLVLMTVERDGADAVAAELHRRALRLEELKADPDTTPSTLDEVRGELIGLRGALGIVLGGSVAGGQADAMGINFYESWMARQEGGR